MESSNTHNKRELPSFPPAPSSRFQAPPLCHTYLKVVSSSPRLSSSPPFPSTNFSHTTNQVQPTPNYETYFPIQTYNQTIRSQSPPSCSSHVIYPTIAPLIVAFAQTWAPRIPPALCQI
ncbi:hypothetical protein CCUS01_11933 [Colletotrichum cuscutae]|uniref:Uncharacterized protein n=1 Tax=Colletotrichum cuscutae TaxID=1209917 RepID=A0AAI9TYD9_9PEZI|nr:hypothetical protein CCUS01_11933 [Colletotrichum cuscutae]